MLRLTKELEKQIVGAIRSGGYPHVAAQAFGVPRETFDDWLRKGKEGRPRQPYKRFAEEIGRACNQARLRADVHTFQETPRNWLDRLDSAESNAPDPNAWLHAEFLALCRTILEALEPYPEARAAAAAALSEGENDVAKERKRKPVRRPRPGPLPPVPDAADGADDEPRAEVPVCV